MEGIEEEKKKEKIVVEREKEETNKWRRERYWKNVVSNGRRKTRKRSKM